MMKRVISLLLVLVMLTGMLPVFAQAQEEPTTAVDNGELTVEGTNGFGNLLAEDIVQAQNSMEEQAAVGYTITGLEIIGNTATVTYDSLEEATVVVALYTEDGMQLLTSGKTTIIPEETTARVTIDGEIPQYFMASAYLLDSYDLSPLCPAYDTPMYTWEMQELLASTAEDYDRDRVLQLEDDPETNFAVYAYTTKVIEPEEGVNMVVSVNDESRTYIIENADERITSLQMGDIFAYSYGENEVLIAKVATIDIQGKTATIIGDDLEIEDVFSQVKIEGESTTEEFAVDDSTCGDGVTFEGISGDASPYARSSGSTEIGTNQSLEFTIDEKVGGGSALEVSVKVAGSLKIELATSLTYYISFTRQFVEFKTDLTAECSFSVSGKVELTIPLGKITAAPVPGVGIGFKPEFKVEVSAKIEVVITFKTTVGASYESGKGFQNLCSAPTVETDVKVEGKLFIGVDLFPVADVLGGALAEIGISAPVGVELTAKLTGTSIDNNERNAPSIHSCDKCLAMELIVKAELTAEFEFIKMLKFEHTLFKKEFKLTDMYYSFAYNKFGFGTCPYESFLVAIQVQDANGTGLPDIPVGVSLEDGNEGIFLEKTNSNGVTTVYLAPRKYLVHGMVGDEFLQQTIEVKGSRAVVLKQGTSGDKSSFITDKVNAGEVVEYDTVIASGECGADGDNVTWKFYSGGTMKIEGSGAMMDWIYETTGWDDYLVSDIWSSIRRNIMSVEISEGITHIGDYAFWGCDSLTAVSMPMSVVSIGRYPFSRCDNLQYNIYDCGKYLGNAQSPYLVLAATTDSNIATITIHPQTKFIGDRTFSWHGELESVDIPDGVISIGENAFSNCSSFTNVIIPCSVTYIGVGAFSCCNKLISIAVSKDNPWYSTDSFGVLYNKDRTTLIQFPCSGSTVYAIPKGVTYIGEGAFAFCSSLTSVIIPNSVTSIGSSAFMGCSSLTDVTIPNSVASIGKLTFSNSGLTSVSIPNSVATIGDEAFSSCYSLTSVTIGDSVISIGDGAFYDCYRLTSVTIPNSVTSIGYRAFSGCDSLTSVTIPNSVTYIGGGAFNGCNSLTSVSIPDSITDIGGDTFSNCDSLTSVTIPDGITHIVGGMFSGCDSLISITIPNSVTSIGYRAFSSCDSLTSMTIPNSVTYIGDDAFSYCNSLTSVTIPNSVTYIGDGAFSYCTGLIGVTIPDSVTRIKRGAFNGCNSLTSVSIPDSVTDIEDYAFYSCYSLINVYYTGTQEQWHEISVGSGNSNLLNAAIHHNNDGVSVSFADASVVIKNGGILSGDSYAQLTTRNAVFGGIYDTEETNSGFVRTASFTGLVAGKEYVLLALVSLGVQDPLSSENILFIDQGTAGEDGALLFRYIQRKSTAVSYVMACGASNKDLKNAIITFPEIHATNEIQMVQPTVVYDGKTLVEGQDYVIAGDMTFDKAGVYTCYIRGIYNYTGLVCCDYTVMEAGAVLSGTVTSFNSSTDAITLKLLQDGTATYTTTVTGNTASYSFENITAGIYTLQISKKNHVTRQYRVTVSDGTVSLPVKIHLIGDVSGDGKVNVGDTAMVYAHVKNTAPITDEYMRLCADVSGDTKINVGDTAKIYAHVKNTSPLW